MTMTPKQRILRQAIISLAHKDYGRGLNARAFFKTGDHAVSDDLVQDTFLKTWKYLVKVGKIETMKSFLFHVLNALIIDQYRKHKAVSLDSLLEKGFEPSENTSNRMLHILDGKAAVLLISKLPIAYRKIMRMRHVQDLSLEEMSLITGHSKNYLAVQLHRGLEKLKLLYKP